MMKNMVRMLILTLSLSTILSANIQFDENNPNDEFAKMQKFVNNMMGSSFFQDGFRNLNNISYPRMDMQELDDKFVIKFELAGIDKNDIKLSLKDTVLILEGEKKVSKDDKSKNYIKHEIFVGKFKRAIKLPRNTITNKLQNKYKNGILTVTIPKKKVSKASYRVLKIN
jgi:HSP20 family protein